MHYFVTLTKECNLRCSYCGGGSDTPPKEIKYSIDDLKSFLSTDSSPVVEFYGGEPLLRIQTLERIMDEISARFILQTNGFFLDRLEVEYLQKFHTILASIDGTIEVTDSARGKGVGERILRNITLIKERGFKGDLVARMTVRKGTDVFDNVRYLLSTGLFDHVHWQLDFTIFWQSGEDDESGPEGWLESYNSGVRSLANYWISEMYDSGKVLGIVPFVGLMNSLLSGRPSSLRCGAGIDCFTVMPDGRISACPVSIDYDFSILGTIFENTPHSLCHRVSVGEPCISCDIYSLCGGRCLLVNKSQQMLQQDGFYNICSTVLQLTNEMKKCLPVVQSLIEDHRIKRSDFEYPTLNNGCEIIP
ncbi:MAG: TIGR04084 family radical SAM/SPASM domain-containing protein [Nitrososphaerota archaeon]|nr:TIGR04084 family radical SAM/SPASM domain-containing protein [Nitrososphaerota archaeon]MDG6922657.1 TIGR04084 family radical SAM/SPASM domain-containing protein [Nitrososphaerota archaeon]